MSARDTLFALTIMAAPAFNVAMAQEKPLPPQPEDSSIGSDIYEDGSLIITSDEFNIRATAMEITTDAQGAPQISPLPEFNFVHIRCHGAEGSVPTFNIGFHMFQEQPVGEKLGYADALRNNAEPPVFLDEEGKPIGDTVLSRSFAVTQGGIRVLDTPEDYRQLLNDYQKGAWSTQGISLKENAARFLPEVRALCLSVG